MSDSQGLWFLFQRPVPWNGIKRLAFDPSRWNGRQIFSIEKESSLRLRVRGSHLGVGRVRVLIPELRGRQGVCGVGVMGSEALRG